MSYPGKFTSESGTVWPSFDSVIPTIATLVLLEMHLILSFFESKLLSLYAENVKFSVEWFPYGRAYIWRSLNYPRI